MGNKSSKKAGPTVFQRAFYQVIKFLVTPILWLKFRFKGEKIRPSSTPCLVMSNHTTDWDPLFIGSLTNRYMYFVASEHIMRWGFASRLIKACLDPVLRVKGKTESHCALEIIRRLRRGSDVCIFAEGNLSYNGETGPILPATGKLARRSGAGLLTFRMTGGYLTNPRWRKSLRRGRITGKVVGEYSAEELAAMSDDEVNALIARDLYVDAYAEQQKEKIAYKGKDLAENIEVGLYTCPSCGAIGTLFSNGGHFGCKKCGLSLIYDEYGSIISDKTPAPFSTVLAWDRWQTEQLEKLINQDGNEPLFSDDGQQLFEIKNSVELFLRDEGTLIMYRDRLAISGQQESVFMLGALSDLSINGKLTLTFVTNDDKQYEIKSKTMRSPVKYREAYSIIKNRTSQRV